MRTALLSLFLGLSAAASQGKSLPEISEPSWDVWGTKTSPDVEAAWADLLAAKPGAGVERGRIDAARRTLEAAREVACGVGARLLRGASDDHARLTIGGYLVSLDEDRGEAFLTWALARVKEVDPVFEFVYGAARATARLKDPGKLRAVFAVLRVRKAQVNRFTGLHMWTISQQDAIFFVLSTYGRDCIPYLYPFLSDPEDHVRSNAALALGAFFDDGARSLLADLLRRDDLSAGAAAYALGELGAKDLAGPIQGLLNSKEPMARFCAAYALYEFGDPAALPALGKALEGERDDGVRGELELAVNHLRKSGEAAPAATLSPEELRDAIGEALKAEGLKTDKTAAIAASADASSLPALLRIRDAAAGVDSKHAPRACHAWREVIKSVRRRSPQAGAIPVTPLQEPALTDDELDRQFIQANIFIARELLKKGDRAKAVSTLEDIIKSHPKHVATREAEALLMEARKK
ncbi:MAG TPA: HEAT repeat domain-containing protein [Planctomycetota bacterium]